MSKQPVSIYVLLMVPFLMACGLSTEMSASTQAPSLATSAIQTSAATSASAPVTASPGGAQAATPGGNLTATAAPAVSTSTGSAVPLSLFGTPPPAASKVISPANAASLAEVARWGKGPANSLAFSPDGRSLAVASPTGIYFYDPATLQEVRHIDTGTPAGQIAFSADGKSLAAIVNGKLPDNFNTTGIVTGNQVNLYDVASGHELHNFSTPYKEGITSVALSPDGKTLAYGADDFSIHLVDVASGNDLQKLNGHSGMITHLVFLPDNKTLASSSIDSTAILWDVSSGSVIHTLGAQGSSELADMAVSQDGTTLATAYDSQDMAIWDTASGKALHMIHGDKPSTTFMSVAFSPDGKTLAASTGDLSTWLIDVQSGSKLRELKAFARGMVFSPDGKTLALGDTDSTVRLLDARSGNLINASEEHSGPLTSLLLSADGKTLVATHAGTYSGENSLSAFDVATGASHALDDKGSCRSDFSPALSSDGGTLALICYNGQDYIGRLDVPSGRMTGNITPKPYENGVEVGAIAFSPDGRTLAVASSLDYTNAPQIRFYNMAGGMHTSQEQFTASAVALAFSPDGSLLAMGPNKTVKCDGCEAIPQPVGIWDVAKAKQILSIPGFKDAVTSLAFSPDGKLLITGTDDQTIKVWDLSNGNQIHEMDSAGLHIHLAISPDGSLLAAGTGNGMLTLWNTSTWEQVATEPASAEAVVGLAFTPDGKFIVTGTTDGAIRFWAAQP